MAGDENSKRKREETLWERLVRFKQDFWMLTPRPSVHNFTGDNLLECDQNVLKDMGVKKIGDRVRIFIAIKQLRTKALGNLKKRNRVRASLLRLPRYQLTEAGLVCCSGQQPSIYTFIFRIPSSSQLCKRAFEPCPVGESTAVSPIRSFDGPELRYCQRQSAAKVATGGFRCQGLAPSALWRS